MCNITRWVVDPLTLSVLPVVVPPGNSLRIRKPTCKAIPFLPQLSLSYTPQLLPLSLYIYKKKKSGKWIGTKLGKGGVRMFSITFCFSCPPGTWAFNWQNRKQTSTFIDTTQLMFMLSYLSSPLGLIWTTRLLTGWIQIWLQGKRQRQQDECCQGTVVVNIVAACPVSLTCVSDVAPYPRFQWQATPMNSHS